MTTFYFSLFEIEHPVVISMLAIRQLHYKYDAFLAVQIAATISFQTPIITLANGFPVFLRHLAVLAFFPDDSV